MKTDGEIKQWAEKRGLMFEIPDGFPEAFIGVINEGEATRAVYDVEKIISILMGRDGMNHGDAREYFSFNVEGGSHPETGPIFIQMAR